MSANEFGPAGRSLIERLTADYEYGEREARILEMAARQLDTVSRLEALVEEHGELIVAPSGALKLNPAVAELRQARLAATRLLGQLDLPEDEDRPVTYNSQRARRAARARWDREARRDGAD